MRERHPPGLYVMFLTEMWERFSFYLLLGILPLYLGDSQKGGMGWSDGQTAMLVGSYIALVYFTPFIGGLVADRMLGLRRTILIGGVLMMFGHLVLAWPTELGLFLGLGLVILGNGAFKPNISTLLGNLYPPGSPLKDAGYNIFYMGINIGAFVCNFVAAIVRNYFDEHPLQLTTSWQLTGWHAAFSTAAFGMLLGLLLFLAFYSYLAKGETPEAKEAGPRESLTPLWVQCLIPAACLGALGWYLSEKGYLGFNPPTAAFIGACLPVIVFYVNILRSMQTPSERSRVGALLVVFAVVITFWMTFHLNTTALTFWARDNTDRQPGTAASLLTDRFTEFAENAPPAYFTNATADMPRPARSSFEIVSEEKYKELEKSKQLRVVEGQKVYVTQAMFDKIYANTNASTPVLPEGKHLKLINAELYESINPGFIILLTPLLVGFWHFLRARGIEPSTPAKIGLGLFLTCGSPLIMLLATIASNDGAVKASSWWLVGTYFMVSIGELCLSPMGLSLVNRVAPARISAFMMGGWFLSTSFGNKLSGIFGEAYVKMEHRLFWTVLICCNLFFSAVIFLLVPWLRRQMESKEHDAH